MSPVTDWVSDRRSSLKTHPMCGVDARRWGSTAQPSSRSPCNRRASRAPRDSDMQEARLGEPINPNLRVWQRGDLVFWPGHVGIMLDEARCFTPTLCHVDPQRTAGSG
jgi:hypothetical protein